MSWKEANHGNIHTDFSLQCVKLILCELLISPLPVCPEWLIPIVNRNLQNFSLAYFLAVFYALFGLCLFRGLIPVKSFISCKLKYF